MAYLLDADVFISAKNLHYGMDFCPAFWDWLIREHTAGRVHSVEKVGTDLRGHQDDLADWARGLHADFFQKADANVLSALGTVADWVNGQNTYSPAAKSTFLRVSDYYLVAQALAGRHVVVTRERPENSVHRVKIPNVCLGVGVDYKTPFEMLRLERARFILEAPK